MFPLLALMMVSEHALLIESSHSGVRPTTVSPNSDAAYNAIMGLLHAIPSNHDIALLLDSMLAL
jgi:hypothetical protein